MSKGADAGRSSVALAVSVSVHAILAVVLILLPKVSKETWDTVDMSVVENEPELPEPEIEEEQPEEEEVEPEPEKPKPKPKKADIKKPEPPPAAVPDEPEPEEAPKEEAPPVFDLGDNTFAQGQGAGWSLNRSEGNTKFASVAKPGDKSARDTKPKTDPKGKPGGKGFEPVPAKNLSKKPTAVGSIDIPPYPLEAKREGIEGRVILQVFIGKDGRVKRVRVVKDPGGGLGLVAKKAMMKERWNPALNKSGQPVDTVITYAYRFVLDG